VCTTCFLGTPSRFCDIAAPAAPRPPPRHHPGCACTADAECPTDVAAFVRGLCTLRPFPGGACAADGPPCFASECRSPGVCSQLGVGQGPCTVDGDCVAGLVCATTSASRLHTCVRRLQLGDSCGPSVVGECRDSCCDGTVCATDAHRGGSCVDCACCLGSTCSITTHTCQ
jgi:hypothetical protein